MNNIIMNNNNNNNSKDMEFQIGELVFAKMKGYPPWPAKIIEINNNKKYTVQFYGTGDSASIKFDNLFLYINTKEKYATPSNLKRRKFRQGIEELKAELHQRENPDENQMDIDSTDLNLEKFITNNKNIEQTENGNENNNVYNGKHDKMDYEMENESLVNSENIQTIEAKFVNTTMSNSNSEQVAAIKAKNLQLTETTTNLADNNIDNILFLYIPTKIIGIRLNYEKPIKFSNIQEQNDWEQNERIEAEILKFQLQFKQLNINDLKNRLILKPNLTNIDEANFIAKEKKAFEILYKEFEFIQISENIRQSLTVEKPNLDKALEYLKNFKTFKPTELCLIRNPDVVETIYLLRRYVGNIKNLKLNNLQKKAFEKKTKQICNEAKMIYNNFKKIFKQPNTDIFEMEFKKLSQQFELWTKNWKKEQIYILNENEWYEFLEKKKKEEESKKVEE